MLENDSTEQEVVALEEESEEVETESAEATDTEVELDGTDEQTEKEETEEVETKKQSKEDNEKYKAARVRAETEASEKVQEAQNKLSAVLKTFGVSSYEELIKADYAFTAEERKKLEAEAEDKGKDVEDYIEAKETKRMLRYVIGKEQARAEQENIEKAIKTKTEFEMQEFKDAYPDINPDNFLNNKKVSTFADGKLGKYSIKKIADMYFEAFGDNGSDRFAKAKEERSTGIGKGSESVALSKQDRESLKSYNDDNPDCQMTPKEFMSYKTRK